MTTDVDWFHWEENEQDIFEHVKEETEEFVRQNRGRNHKMPQYDDFDAGKEYFKDEVGVRYGGIVNLFREVFDTGYDRTADMIGAEIELGEDLDIYIFGQEAAENREPQEIAEELGVSERRYENWKRRLGLVTTEGSNQINDPLALIEHETDQDVRRYLEQKIVDEGMSAVEVGDELGIGGHHIYRAGYNVNLPKKHLKRPSGYWQQMGNIERELKPVVDQYVGQNGWLPTTEDVADEGLGAIADALPEYHNMSFLEGIQETFKLERNDNSRFLTWLEIDQGMTAEEFFKKEYLEKDRTMGNIAEELGVPEGTVITGYFQFLDLPGKREYREK